VPIVALWALQRRGRYNERTIMIQKKHTSGKSDPAPLADPDRLPDDMDQDDIGEAGIEQSACPEPEDAGSIQRPPADS